MFAVAVQDFNGSFSAEHAIGRKNQAYYDLYTQQKIKDMAQGLKAITSPGELGRGALRIVLLKKTGVCSS